VFCSLNVLLDSFLASFKLGHPVSRLVVTRVQAPAALACNLLDGQKHAHTISETPCIPETPCKDLTPKIYVTEYTLPSWTPLVARTAALVTDSGGVLSHSAVVARKYGIPTVVGTGTATAIIRDGTAGRVRMVSQNDKMQF
jgi:phosphohistidine swiveling domain-containing protein